MISLKHLQIVKDAAEIELAMSKNKDNELYYSAMRKFDWIQDELDKLSLDSDICILCNGTGKLPSTDNKCDVCAGIGYLKYE